MDGQQPRRLVAGVPTVVLLPPRSPEYRSGAENIAATGRLLDEFALDPRQDNGTRVLVHAGLSTWVPAVVANLEIDRQRNIGNALLEYDLDAHLGRRLRYGETQRN